MANDVNIKLGVTGEKELSDALDNITAKLKVNKSELALVTAEYGKNTQSIDGMTKKGEALQRIIASQSEKTKLLSDALKKEIAQSGLSAKATQEKQAQLNRAQAELIKYTKNLRDNADAIKKAEQAEEDVSDAIEGTTDAIEDAANASEDFSEQSKKAGDSANKSTKGIGAMTIALGDLAAKGIEKAITGFISLSKEMQEYNYDMAKLETNAKMAGVSVDYIREKEKELMSVTNELDSTVEALSVSLATKFSENQLNTALDAAMGAAIKFSDTIKAENFAESLQESLAIGKATGQFEETLTRLGINVEKFNQGLQRAAKTGRESAYVTGVLMKSGLLEVYEEYRNLNPELISYSEAQTNLMHAMADLSKKTMPVMAEVITEITALLDEHADSVESIIGLIAAIANIILNIIAVLAMVPAPVWAILATIIATVTAIMKAQEALSGVSEALKIFTGGLSPAQMKILQIITIVTALASVLALLAMLWLSIKEGSDKAVSSMERMKNIQIAPPTVSTPKVKNAYAKGTFSAANGWALVGEDGPELVAFSGGERVYNARKTRSILESGISTGGGTQIGTLNIYPNASQWNQLMNLLQQSQRARHDSRMK